MNKGKGLLLVISALVCVALGFVVGQVVQATGNQPGSKSDPLVTRSYVEESVGAKLSVMQTQLDELRAEVSQLKGDSDILPSGTGDTTQTGDGTTSGNQTEQKIRITSSSVNVRRAPSTDSDIIDSVSSGTELTYVGQQDGWYEIRTESGAEGYVADYLAEIVE